MEYCGILQSFKDTFFFPFLSFFPFFYFFKTTSTTKEQLSSYILTKDYLESTSNNYEIIPYPQT